MSESERFDWPTRIHQVLGRCGVRQVAYVPDTGHKRLIELCSEDRGMRAIPLTTEEEGIGLLAGAWLGGERGTLLMQSSGVGNCVNAIASITQACRFPLFLLITMRGESGESNPWQVPMGRATAPVLETLGVALTTVDHPHEVEAAVASMAARSFEGGAAAGVLLSQRLIGTKVFRE